MAHKSLSLVFGLVPALLLAAVLQDRPQPGQDKTEPAKGGPAKGGPAEGGPAKGRIAVVDIKRVVLSTSDWEKAKADLKKLGEELKGELNTLKNGMSELRHEMELKKNPSAALDGLILEYQLQKSALATREKIYSDRMDREDLRTTLAIYEKVDQAIAELAKKRKIQLVIRKTTVGKPRSLLQRRDYHFRRPVFYSEPELDITEDVIKYLKAQ